MNNRLWILGGLLAATLLSCSPIEKPARVPDGRVVVLVPAVDDAGARVSRAVLKETYPAARQVKLTEVSAALTDCLASNRVLIIPAIRSLPVESWKPLRDYLEQGGAAVLWGCQPFEARARLVNGKIQTEQELFQEVFAQARHVDNFSEVDQWKHENDWGAPRGEVRAIESESVPWPCVRVGIERFRDWDAMIRPDIPPGTIAENDNSLAFYVRAEPGTSRLAVIAAEDDGSHWSYVVNATPDWQPVVLHEAKFEYFYGGNTRGTATDRLKLSRVRKLSIGLSMHLGAQQPGDHAFEVSEFRLVTDPRPPAETVEWPDVFLVSPPYRHYDLRAAQLRPVGSGQVFAVDDTPVQSPIPRSRGWGGEGGAPFRWVPVFVAEGHDSNATGWPASLFIEPAANGATKRWAWIGVEPSEKNNAAVQAMLRECVTRLQAGRFLYKTGARQFAFEQGESVKAVAHWTRGASADTNLTVAAEFIDASGKILKQVSEPVANRESAEFDLGVAPDVTGEAVDYTVRISLAGDRLEQPVKVLPVARAPGDDEWVTTGGGYFQHGGKPVFLLGTNYWPLNHNGKSPGEFAPHWLDSAMFDPEIVCRDLDRLKEIGVNAVSIQYHDENQAPQLKYFIDEARKRGIWVHAFVGYLQPLDQNFPKARRLIEAARLSECPQVFAIDVAWEPHLGSYGGRARFDAQWDAWLREQYGSIEHAESVVGRGFLTRDGVATGPSDEQLRTDGSHRAMVAVYRRFVDDFMSRRYGEVERLVRNLGCRQLLSARSGYGGTGNAWADPFLPIDLAAGAVHFDFISPEGWSLTGSAEQFDEAGFITAYGRGVSGGKPVVWLEFGSSVGRNPQSPDLENQARVYSNLFALASDSRAAAAFGWWYPGGYRVDEKSDMGIVNLDGRWRPAGSVHAAFRQQMQEGLPAVAEWTGREIDRSANARGISALWDKWQSVYREETAKGELAEVRPEGFGKLTTELPVVSVGNVDYENPAPLKFVNAEWGRAQVNERELERPFGGKIGVQPGERLRVELINTGPATWAEAEAEKARTVWVEITLAGKSIDRLPVKLQRFGERAWVEWAPPAAGRYTLRLLLLDAGQFGEPLEIEVAGQGNVP